MGSYCKLSIFNIFLPPCDFFLIPPSLSHSLVPQVPHTHTPSSFNTLSLSKTLFFPLLKFQTFRLVFCYQGFDRHQAQPQYGMQSFNVSVSCLPHIVCSAFAMCVCPPLYAPQLPQFASQVYLSSSSGDFKYVSSCGRTDYAFYLHFDITRFGWHLWY